jgi:hypothetical protein
MRDHHELGEFQSSQEKVVRGLKISDLKLYSLCAEIFLSPEGYRKRDLTNGGRYCTMDYAIERSPTGAQQRPGYPHLVKSLQEQNVQGAAYIDEDSVELDILDNGANYERIHPRLWHKV